MSENKKKIVKKRILPCMLICISLPLIICFAIPFETFANNLDEFIFSLSDFLPLTLTFGLLLALVFFNLFLFLPEKGYKICTRVYLAVALMFYLQGTFLNKSLNSLLGDNIGSQDDTRGIMIFNLIIWLVVIGVFVALSLLKDKKGIISTISKIIAVIIIFTQIIVPVSISISNSKVFKSSVVRVSEDNLMYDHKIITYKNLTTYSSNRNIFYFVVDRFDEYYAEEAYRNDPELFDMFEGFTSYNDHVSRYAHTYPSVAYMLTNKTLDINNSRAEYLNSAYEDDKTMSVLANKGYMVNMFTERYYAYTEANNLPSYISNIGVANSYKVTNPAMLALNMIRMSLYRCLPSVMKKITGNLNTNSFNAWISYVSEDGFAEYSVQPKDVFNQIQNDEFKAIEQNVFSFIHLQGVHSTNVEYDNGNKKQSKSTVKSIIKQVRSNFKVIKEFLDALKSAGVYENATIIITGDHAAPVKDNVPLAATRLTALMVKPSGQKDGKLKFSTKQVAHENIWPTIFQSEGMDLPHDFSESIMDIQEGEDRTREYVWHTYMPGSLDEYVYTINGSARSFANWEIKAVQHKNKHIMD